MLKEPQAGPLATVTIGQEKEIVSMGTNAHGSMIQQKEEKTRKEAELLLEEETEEDPNLKIRGNLDNEAAVEVDHPKALIGLDPEAKEKGGTFAETQVPPPSPKVLGSGENLLQAGKIADPA